MPSTLGDDDLELDGASATIKLDDSTFGGVTRCVDGISSLTLPLPDGSPASEYVDTGINLPAFSVLRYIFIKKTTAGVNGNGTLWVSNFAMTLPTSTTSLTSARISTIVPDSIQPAKGLDWKTTKP